MTRPVGRVVISPDFVSIGAGFKSRLRRKSAHDCMALHSKKPFIITLQSSRYDLNTVERDVKYQNIIIYLFTFDLRDLNNVEMDV